MYFVYMYIPYTIYHVNIYIFIQSRLLPMYLTDKHFKRAPFPCPAPFLHSVDAFHRLILLHFLCRNAAKHCTRLLRLWAGRGGEWQGRAGAVAGCHATELPLLHLTQRSVLLFNDNSHRVCCQSKIFGSSCCAAMRDAGSDGDGDGDGDADCGSKQQH